PRLDLAFANTGLSRDTAIGGETRRQVQLTASETWARAHAAVTARVASDPRPLQVDAAFDWDPLPLLTLAADARHASYNWSRSGNRVHVSAGLRLPLGLSAHGDIAQTRDVAAPALRRSPTQHLDDVSGAVHWESSHLTLDV